MKVDCLVGDLQILRHLLQQVSIQQKLHTMENMKILR